MAKPTTLRVKETGEFGRYIVESHSRPDRPYFVDLCERIDHDGKAHGRCNCTWFSTNANQNYLRHKLFIPYRTDEAGKVREGCSECKHIAAARNHYHVHVTMPMLATMRQGITPGGDTVSTGANLDVGSTPTTSTNVKHTSRQPEQ